MERITIDYSDLHSSSSLTDGGYKIIRHTHDDGTIEECPFFIIGSEASLSEEEALASFNKKLALILEHAVGNKYYMLQGEIKVWRGKSKKDEEQQLPDKYAAYSLVGIPGVTTEKIKQILHSI